MNRMSSDDLIETHAGDAVKRPRARVSAILAGLELR
jgi:hypothetical protein